jgi:hypothetical protein
LAPILPGMLIVLKSFMPFFIPLIFETIFSYIFCIVSLQIYTIILLRDGLIWHDFNYTWPALNVRCKFRFRCTRKPREKFSCSVFAFILSPFYVNLSLRFIASYLSFLCVASSVCNNSTLSFYLYIFYSTLLLPCYVSLYFLLIYSLLRLKPYYYLLFRNLLSRTNYNSNKNFFFSFCYLPNSLSVLTNPISSYIASQTTTRLSLR